MRFGELIHSGAGGEVVRRLRAAVQHHDQRRAVAGERSRDVQLVVAAALRPAIGSPQELPDCCLSVIACPDSKSCANKLLPWHRHLAYIVDVDDLAIASRFIAVLQTRGLQRAPYHVRHLFHRTAAAVETGGRERLRNRVVDARGTECFGAEPGTKQIVEFQLQRLFV
ncbi:MAG TPA: hypothetical protein VM491_15990 [Burkholderiaceae bacterium]|nr:hypothetical protein [Burkholderiaceae bacterium]